MTIFDADILSTFAKINRLGLIKRLFGTIYITPMIKEELLAPLEYGYKFPLQILNDSIVILPTEGELSLYSNFRTKLGKGEAEAISIAQARKLLFVTNDKVAQEIAKENGVSIISMQAILKASLENHFLLQTELFEVIKDMRFQDGLIIPEDEIKNILSQNKSESD